MIEHSHLKIIQALQQNGTLTEAANALFLSQSALSHQIRYLEKKLDVKLWEKSGRNIRLTQAGELLLVTAEHILPILEQTEKTLKALAAGQQGHLRIGVECYPCYEWLTRIIGHFIEQMPDIDIDIINKFQFSGLEGLLNHHIDILITPDKVIKPDIIYVPLVNYELVLVMAQQHPLANLPFLLPEHLADKTLLIFPVARERLDILTHFLLPAHIETQKLQVIESLDIMLKLTELQRGVCVLPQWLADNKNTAKKLTTLAIGKTGMHRQLFLAMRKQDQDIAYIQKFIKIGQEVNIK